MDPKTNKPFWFKGTFYALVVIVGLLLGGIVGIIIGFNIPTEPPPPKAATILYDVNEKEVSRLFQENRVPISLDQIPQTMKDAIIAVEDREFYKHRGVNFRSIVRALIVDIREGGFSQGASTITQQLARNALLTQKKTINRKLKEIFIAFNLERNLTKDEILEKYLNQIYFGHGAWGVESASQLYFGKPIGELELEQYALLAALPRGPGLYSPYVDKTRALRRRAIVLQAMATNGYITSEQAKAVSEKDLGIVPLRKTRGHAAYFVDYVLQELINRYNLDEEAIYTEGFRIYTTLDKTAQEAAEAAIKNLPEEKADALGVMQPQGAIVALDPQNGYIKAMVGGRDFQNTQLNRAVKAHRQPGSAIKPFVYIAALESGSYTPATIVVDEPVSFPAGGGKTYSPRNYDGKYRGPISVRVALENSINTIAVKIVEQLGPSRILGYARKMGLTSLVTTGAKNDLNLSSMGLGGLTHGVTPLELASAYSPLANRGIYSEPIAILMVKDEQGNVLFENTPKKRVAIKEETAYLMTDMLRGVIENGTGRRAQIGRPAAGKTGTTSDYTNAWFVGYTPELVAAVWIGNDSQRLPIRIKGTVLSSSTAAAIWGDFMKEALRNTPVNDFIPPESMVTHVEICTESGYLASSLCHEIRYETFLPGTEPRELCPMHSNGHMDIISVEICTESGQLATADCPRSHIQRRRYDRFTHLEIRDGTPLPTERCPIHDTQQTVTVRICMDSGYLATPYCPKDQIVVQVYAKGEEPQIYCDIHRSRNW